MAKNQMINMEVLDGYINPNPPGGGHTVLTVIRCKIVQQIIKYKKTENILS
jgi:hypothetical protein